MSVLFCLSMFVSTTFIDIPIPNYFQTKIDVINIIIFDKIKS